MKQFLTALPLTFILVGCSGPIEETALSANSAIDSAANAKPTATPDPKAPDVRYRVVTEGERESPEDAPKFQALQVPPPPTGMAVPDKAKVRLDTSKGAIVLELNGKAAPLHVKSFLYLGQRGFYNGTIFHRYEPGFVIQGGDPISRNPATANMAGRGGPGYQTPREYNELKHDKMVLAAARTPDPDSAGSQFYITLAPAPNLDVPPGYTVFGKVLSGQDVVLKLRGSQGPKLGDKLTKFTVLK